MQTSNVLPLGNIAYLFLATICLLIYWRPGIISISPAISSGVSHGIPFFSSLIPILFAGVPPVLKEHRYFRLCHNKWLIFDEK